MSAHLDEDIFHERHRVGLVGRDTQDRQPGVVQCIDVFRVSATGVVEVDRGALDQVRSPAAKESRTSRTKAARGASRGVCSTAGRVSLVVTRSPARPVGPPRCSHPSPARSTTRPLPITSAHPRVGDPVGVVSDCDACGGDDHGSAMPTSSPTAVVNPEWVGPGAPVCDSIRLKQESGPQGSSMCPPSWRGRWCGATCASSAGAAGITMLMGSGLDVVLLEGETGGPGRPGALRGRDGQPTATTSPRRGYASSRARPTTGTAVPSAGRLQVLGPGAGPSTTRRWRRGTRRLRTGSISPSKAPRYRHPRRPVDVGDARIETKIITASPPASSNLFGAVVLFFATASAHRTSTGSITRT